MITPNRKWVRDIPKPRRPIMNYRKLANTIADVLDEWPHLLQRTGGLTARKANGALTMSSDPRAVAFCAIGMICRAEECGATTSRAASELIAELNSLNGVKEKFGRWFEESPQVEAKEYASILRGIARGDINLIHLRSGGEGAGPR